MVLRTLMVAACFITLLSNDCLAQGCWSWTPSGSCETSYGDRLDNTYCGPCNPFHKCDTVTARQSIPSANWNIPRSGTMQTDTGWFTKIDHEFVCITFESCLNDCAFQPADEQNPVGFWYCVLSASVDGTVEDDGLSGPDCTST